MKRSTHHIRRAFHRVRGRHVAKAIGLAGGVAALAAGAYAKGHPGHLPIKLREAAHSAHGVAKRFAHARHARMVGQVAHNVARSAMGHMSRIRASLQGVALHTAARARHMIQRSK